MFVFVTSILHSSAPKVTTFVLVVLRSPLAVSVVCLIVFDPGAKECAFCVKKKNQRQGEWSERGAVECFRRLASGSSGRTALKS